MKIGVQTANIIRPKIRPIKTWGARSAIMEVHKEVSKTKEGEKEKLQAREVKKTKQAQKKTMKHEE